MIPEDKKTLVIKALKQSFGVNNFEEIALLTKGLSSALIFKIVVEGKPYLLRVITRTDAMADPARYFGAMQDGAAAGLGPHVYYANTEDRIAITDFINASPFAMTDARRQLPVLLRQLHTLPKFPFRINYPDTMDGMAARFRASGVLPESLLTDIFKMHDRIRSAYPGINDEDWVSCHNDLKPENILFDGTRPWLVDWEASFLNDRYTDLAVVGNFIVKNDADEAELLSRYFGQAATEYQRARFFLMQQMMHLYYFTMFLSIAAAGKPVDPENVEQPGFRIFHDRMWNGEIDLKENDAKLQYGIVHLQQCMAKMHDKRIDAALAIISANTKL